MNTQINHLYTIANKPIRRFIGLMSGTSLDGLDIAICKISGAGRQTQIEVEKFVTKPYTDHVKENIRKVFAKKTIDFEQLTLLNAWLGTYHGQLVNDALADWGIKNEAIDIIASHGQTVYHAPQILHQKTDWPNATLQIGDGDHVAVATGIVTVSDFRQKHVAAGGQGAPLALYGDFLIFGSETENRILLNMGGIANFTFLPSYGGTASVFVTDTGPCNTLIDAFVREFYPNLAYDQDAKIASSGSIIQQLLSALKENDFFERPFPKTTGPELFSKQYVQNAIDRSSIKNITPADLLATLTRFSAETIAEAIKKVLTPNEDYTIYASGGGAHNPLLMRYISELIPYVKVHTTDQLGIIGDAKEAVLFAVLANETLCGTVIDFNGRAGMPSVNFGKISFPQ